ncbi:MAG: hypothetical protein A3I29_03035 [Candidatus Magasanikbacteria bacterium RIFCSPLOWO2_02_FULL_44_11]|uniref:Uncharacterized protein n=2 Tax=Candidatus Magasanikiibacteriota TaxID=1752731 RepID=A0A1F6N9C5_9BACT|nr:MAG: hypothetical protein A3D53_01390 [Candidatus Magasanikbacteria bacterium RIFCSPHIGHO2_02_FULL_45_10]OGH80461.1 MAG: hypothetical protein A3I29_03035 [Candidatus Magasanikbacteria bacterium RIFCSPLOWO2_02_FULL_44_11]
MYGIITDIGPALQDLKKFFRGHVSELRTEVSRFINERLPLPKIGERFELDLPLGGHTVRITVEMKDEHGVPVAEVAAGVTRLEDFNNRKEEASRRQAV